MSSNPSHYLFTPGDKVVLMDSNTVFTIKAVDPINANFTVEGAIIDNPIPQCKAVPLDTAIELLERRLDHLREQRLTPLERYKRKVHGLEQLTYKAPFERIPNAEIKKALHTLCRIQER